MTLAIISPAKTLDFDTPPITSQFSKPEFLKDAGTLVAALRTLSPVDVSTLMRISTRLAELNHQRFSAWHTPFTRDNAKQAVLAFKGDVYQGLEAWTLTARDLSWAQRHLRILSGLYGLLRPLDLIQPYRLEMGTRFATANARDLYAFWGDRLTRSINQVLARQRPRLLVNLASNEYAAAVDCDSIDGRVVTPTFKDWQKDQYRFISFHAKKARGMMAGYIIRERVTSARALQKFDLGGYRYSAAESDGDQWVFLRGCPH